MPAFQYFIKPWYCKILSPINWLNTTPCVHFYMFWSKTHFMLVFTAIPSVKVWGIRKRATPVMWHITSSVQQQSQKPWLLSARNKTDTHWFCPQWSNRKEKWGEVEERREVECERCSQSVSVAALDPRNTLQSSWGCQNLSGLLNTSGKLSCGFSSMIHFKR